MSRPATIHPCRLISAQIIYRFLRGLQRSFIYLRSALIISNIDTTEVKMIIISSVSEATSIPYASVPSYL